MSKLFYTAWQKRYKTLNPEEEKKLAQNLYDIRKKTFDNFDKYYQATLKNLKENNIEVHEAKTIEDAQKYSPS